MGKARDMALFSEASPENLRHSLFRLPQQRSSSSVSTFVDD